MKAYINVLCLRHRYTYNSHALGTAKGIRQVGPLGPQLWTPGYLLNGPLPIVQFYLVC